MIDVLGELVAHRLTHFDIGPADKTVRGCEPGKIGHGLQGCPAVLRIQDGTW
jgi:hypothetical protein